MPDWLTKARDSITRGGASQEPEPFERTCICGEIIRGERREQAQEIECPRCGRDWFILPRDPYPRRRDRSSPSLWKRLGSRNRSAPTKNASSGNGEATAKVAGPQATNDAAKPPRPPLRQRLVERVRKAKTGLRDRARRAAKPLRLVGFGIALLVVLTTVWLWHRARVDAASATIVRVVPQAEEALAERDFSRAERLFAEAVAAVDLLGAKDETALRVRQRHREIAAANSLAAKTPYDLAAEAESLAANPDEWTQRFAASYAGRWVILDVPLGTPEPATVVASDAEKEGGSREVPAKVVRIDMPLFAGERPVRIEIDASVFDPVKSQSRAIFAARYEWWRLHEPKKDASLWVVRLDRDSAFLWTSPDIYAALGFELDDPAAPPRKVLERQAKSLGIPTDNSVGVRDTEGTPE